MVTLQNFFLDKLKEIKYFCVYKVKGSLIYKIPYEKFTSDIKFISDDSIVLKNYITKYEEILNLNEITNIEFYNLYENGNVEEILNESYGSIISYKFNNIDFNKLGDVIFLENFSIKYLKILDTMNIHTYDDFLSIHVDNNVQPYNIRVHNFKKVINFYKDMVFKDLNKIEDESISEQLMDDINENIRLFFIDLENVDIQNLENKWPTLLNPSPYTNIITSVRFDG